MADDDVDKDAPLPPVIPLDPEVEVCSASMGGHHDPSPC